jgi:hypothetical protein
MQEAFVRRLKEGIKGSARFINADLITSSSKPILGPHSAESRITQADETVSRSLLVPPHLRNDRFGNLFVGRMNPCLALTQCR